MANQTLGLGWKIGENEIRLARWDATARRAREVLGGSRQQVVDAVDWMPGDPTQHRAPVGFGGEAVALGGADQGSIAAVRSRRVQDPAVPRGNRSRH